MTAYNPYYESANRPLGRLKVQFSRTELQHLAMAVLALTVAFTFVLAGGVGIQARFADVFANPILLVTSLLAVSSGFVLHELAHKFVAIKYGCLAEFRANMNSLGLSLLIAVFTGWLVALPGAVQIYGRVNARENGIISIVGPGTNMAVALLILPAAIFLDGTLQYVLYVVYFANAVLGAFNLIPAGNFDGRKVLAWSRPAYIVAVVVAAILVVLAFIIPRLAF